MEHICVLFNHKKEYLNHFNKKEYPNAFIRYQSQFNEFLSECDTIYAERQNVDELCKLVAEEICDTACKLKKEQPFKSRMQEETWMEELNLFMVAFVFPAILESRNDYYKELCQKIEKSWSKTFHSKIKAATYETLNSGFNKKAFGLF